EFSHEAMLPYERKTLEKIRDHADTLIKNRLYFVWENGGSPVAMAYIGRPTLNSLGISAVYSPVKHRKKGYASALVSNLSQKIIDSGKKFCVLFSNEQNLTSNRIYERMGYGEVSLVKHFIFDKRN
ncbi:MAG: GNAT family N-acetyltransferase, partial [Bacteriovoracales bacterium]